MSKILENAQKHFKLIHDTELGKVHVKEWEDDVYFKTTLTWKEQSQILEAGQKSSADAIIETLMVKALNKDGSKMFNKVDRIVLENDVDPDTIVKVVGAINNNTSTVAEDEIEKK
tara:strand:+ start:2085 stop:2429 length:345 start_codon:yes stop_codon:yes gene_type:complete